MTNPVVDALDQAAHRIGVSLSGHASTALERMYHDAGRRTEAVATRVADADEANSRALLQIAEGIGQRDATLAVARHGQSAAALNTDRAVLRQRFEQILGPLDTGRVEQSAKLFNPAERRIADLLAAEGHTVEALAESRLPGVRTPDALVDTVRTESKACDPGAGACTVKNALNSAKGQATDAIVDARGSGLSPSAAQDSVAQFLRNNPPDRMTSIRIIGDDYEISWP